MPEPTQPDHGYSPAYRCHKCDDVAVQGGRCEMHAKEEDE